MFSLRVGNQQSCKTSRAADAVRALGTSFKFCNANHIDNILTGSCLRKTIMTVILDDRSPKHNVAANIKLFPHQQALVYKLIEMELKPRENTFIGVMQDPPGSGKSYPLLAMILHEKRAYGRTQNLIVIPPNIHEQWLEYIENFSSELSAKSLMYYGDITALFYDARALFDHDILITTSAFYSMVTSTVRDIGAWFNRVIIDEVDSIAFFTKDEIPSQAVWLVSASADLTKDGAYKKHAKSNTIMCDPAFIRRSIDLPPPVVASHPCFNEYVEILQQDVVEDLGALHAVDFTRFRFEYLRNEKTVTNAQQLLAATFRNKSMALAATKESIGKLEEGAKIQSYAVDEYIKTKAKLVVLTKELQNIVTLLDGRKCPLCASPFEEGTERGLSFCCRVKCCKGCLTDWVDKAGRCPKCCQSMKLTDILADEAPLPAPLPKKRKHLYRDKMDELSEILTAEKTRDNFRILIFSDFSGTLLRVRDILKQHDLPFAELEGNQFTMTRAISDFRSGKKPVLIVDSLQFSSGMNLECTSSVILTHSSERQTQIIGRAQRLGRVGSLHIHHLMYKGEQPYKSPAAEPVNELNEPRFQRI